MNRLNNWLLINTIMIIISLPLSISSYSLSIDAWTAALSQAERMKAKINHKQNLINKFQDEYQLIFIYSSNCPYCHQFAPILAQFVGDNNLKINSLSANGGTILPFNNPEYNPDKLIRLGITTYPTLLAVNKINHKTYLINQGAISYSELKANFKQLIQELYKDRDEI